MFLRCDWNECSRVIFFFFQAEDGIRDYKVTGVQTCALPICLDSPDRFFEESRLLLFVWIARGRKADDTGEEVRGLESWVQAHDVGEASNQKTDRKSVVVGKECRSRWSPYH